MKRYLNILYLIIYMHLKIAFTYRASLYSGAIGTSLWLILALTSISVLTYQSSEIGGWNKYELFVVQGIYSVILGIMYFLFIESFKKLMRSVRWGDLDFTLLKPLDSQFLVSFSEVRIFQLARAFMGGCVIIYGLGKLGVDITVFKIIMFALFSFISSSVVYSIWFMFATLSIWLTYLFNLHELFLHLTGITRYPLEMLRHVSTFLVIVLLPLVVITSVPAQILLNKINPLLIIASFCVAAIFLVVSRKLWFFSLKYYTSVNS